MSFVSFVRGLLGAPPFAAQVKSLPRVGGMATMQSRRGSVEKALATIMPQVDRLHLYLDDYDHVPDFARQERIICHLGNPEARLGCSGRFVGLAQETEPVLFASFDDDILYAANHVDRLRDCVIRRGGGVIAGVHGSNFTPPFTSYIRGRQSFHFQRRLGKEQVVDILGCGTIAFLSDDFLPDPSTFPDKNADDLIVALVAERAGLKRVAVKRSSRWMRAISTKQDDSIWAAVVRDETRAVRHMRALMVEMGRLPASEGTGDAKKPD